MGFLFLALINFILGTPIFVALGLGSVIVLIFYLHMPVETIGQFLLGRVSSYVLLAMPLFMLAGNLLVVGGGVRRMIEFFDALVGHVRGGLVVVTVGFCIFFAAMTGSGYATIAAVGSIMLPEMKRAGYSDGLRSGIIATNGQLGNLIPPSITLVVMGSLMERSVATLFAAGLVPGIMVGLGNMGVGTIIARREGVIAKPKATWRTRGGTFVKAIPAILMPIVILGGIYSGQFTPTEAAAVSCLYAIVIGIFIYGGLRSWQTLKTGFGNALRSAVMIYMIMAAVSTFAIVVSRSGLTAALCHFLLDLGLGTTGVILVWNLFLLVLGFFYNPLGLMYVAIPILAPVFEELGISLIWVAVLWLMNGLVGATTPPMAAGLYITARIAEVDPGKVFKGALPFLGVWVTVLILVVFFPELCLFVPRRVLGMSRQMLL